VYVNVRLWLQSSFGMGRVVFQAEVHGFPLSVMMQSILVCIEEWKSFVEARGMSMHHKQMLVCILTDTVQSGITVVGDKLFFRVGFAL